ncbi:hypothetical protein, partial [Rhodovulum sulfidophilum]|uniref:hypothetical protein n=1 Tax=Rhodovulum sulfidophilum TaxID=35806 RepID=UPI001F47C459
GGSPRYGALLQAETTADLDLPPPDDELQPAHCRPAPRQGRHVVPPTLPCRPKSPLPARCHKGGA